MMSMPRRGRNPLYAGVVSVERTDAMSRSNKSHHGRVDRSSHDPGQLRDWPRRPQRLATAVVEDLVDRIVGGELPTGSALPIEPVLCEMFAVSRTVIREAVKSLEAMQLVTVQQGQGTTVR